jgi:hypothetical protein
MKNLKVKADSDELRSEYNRTDLKNFVRGAITHVTFAERVALMLASIGEEEKIQFTYYAIGNDIARHQYRTWTYEIDSGNQVTLRYWLNPTRNIEVSLRNPPCILTAEDNNNLIRTLNTGVGVLRNKVNALD